MWSRVRKLEMGKSREHFMDRQQYFVADKAENGGVSQISDAEYTEVDI